MSTAGARTEEVMAFEIRGRRAGVGVGGWEGGGGAGDGAI